MLSTDNGPTDTEQPINCPYCSDDVRRMEQVDDETLKLSCGDKFARSDLEQYNRGDVMSWEQGEDRLIGTCLERFEETYHVDV